MHSSSRGDGYPAAADVPGALNALVDARTGHFLLESGHHGNLWLELDRLFSTPARIAPLVSRLAELLVAHRLGVVCGPMSGGAFLAQLVASELGVTFTWAERVPEPATGLDSATYRVPEAQQPLMRDQRVGVVDDVINAGSAARATSAQVEAAGGEVVALGALLVLGDRAAWHASSVGVPLECLARRGSQLWAPEHCPLCQAGQPLHDGASRPPVSTPGGDVDRP